MTPAAPDNRPWDVAWRFTERFRRRETLVGYWAGIGVAGVAERLGRVGYDYICFDMQHGLIDDRDLVPCLTALEAAGAGTAGMVRVGANDPYLIGRALDAGAAGVIVPLIQTAADAERAVQAVRYPERGTRSFGPLRHNSSSDTAGSLTPLVIVMIETASALDSLDDICAVADLDGVYIGPTDLGLSLAARNAATADRTDLATARTAVVGAADRAVIGAGMHVMNGSAAADSIADGFTFTSVASDLRHIEAVAAEHLAAARRPPATN
jgi:4-hydroxy-2-oxoheptanedioate aldolase